MPTKICLACGVEKDPSDFYISSRGRKCKDCVKTTNKQYRGGKVEEYRAAVYARKVKRRVAVKEAKDKPCMDCKQRFLPCQMDFDHRDRSTKIANVSRMISNDTSLKLLIVEIKKCDLVCANCHRLREYRRKYLIPMSDRV